MHSGFHFLWPEESRVYGGSQFVAGLVTVGGAVTVAVVVAVAVAWVAVACTGGWYPVAMGFVPASGAVVGGSVARDTPVSAADADAGGTAAVVVALG